MTLRLSRESAGLGAPAPVRMVHLGLGRFFRAHQAWYTDRAPDAAHWGIAAFTGRSSGVANTLRSQDGVYTLVTQGPGGPDFSLVGSLTSVHSAADRDAWVQTLASPQVSVVTATVTEAGWTGPDVPTRLVAGLTARRRADAGAISIVPCDNLSQNGAVAQAAVRDLAAAVDPTLSAWIDDHVHFVTTMVDRITPATTEADRALVARATGMEDGAPVVTEEFSEWVLAGEFPSGRPDWEAAGAVLVPTVEPFERRKLWLLNGGHSLLAYAGGLRGHTTVAQSIADPLLRAWVDEWWDEAERHLGQGREAIRDYRAALLGRFANPGIRHLLSQVAQDGSQKLPVRILPVLREELAQGRTPRASARVLAAWVLHLTGRGVPVQDAGAQFPGLQRDPIQVAVSRVLGQVAPDLAHDRALTDAVVSLAEELM